MKIDISELFVWEVNRMLQKNIPVGVMSKLYIECVGGHVYVKADGV